MMRRHSPYNYAFNNPVYFIDPDGMSPIPGGLKSGLLVQDTNFLGVSDISNGNMGSTAIGESIAPEQNNTAAYKDYFQQVSDYAANADESLGGGCPDGDCDDKKSTKNPLKTALPCVKCHHSASVPQGNESGLIDLFKSRQSGYIQYGGNMRSGFIGDVIGEHGKLYGSIDNLLYPSDRSSKIKFLNYIIKLKGGGEIGYALIESAFRDEDINIKTFRYPIQEGYWVKRSRGQYRHYRTKVIKGYIINDKDTIYGN